MSIWRVATSAPVSCRGAQRAGEQQGPLAEHGRSWLPLKRTSFALDPQTQARQNEESWAAADRTKVERGAGLCGDTCQVSHRGFRVDWARGAEN